MEDIEKTERPAQGASRAEAAALLCALRESPDVTEAVARVRALLDRETAAIHHGLRPSPPDRLAARRALARFDAAKARAISTLDAVETAVEPAARAAAADDAVTALVELFDGPHADLVAWPACLRIREAA